MANREIRDILLGRIVRLDEDHWAAAPAGTKLISMEPEKVQGMFASTG